MLGYAATYREQLHRTHFGVDFFYALNVTTSAERVDNLIDTFQEHKLAPSSAFLFTP